MNGKIVARIVSALVLIAAIAGIAYFAFNAGIAKGSPVTIQAPSGEAAQMPYPNYGYGMVPIDYPFGFGFGCLGLLIPLFLFFLAMKAFRFMFWGPRWGHHMGSFDPWRRHIWGEGGIPSMFREWHDLAHGKTGTDKKDG